MTLSPFALDPLPTAAVPQPVRYVLRRLTPETTGTPRSGAPPSPGATDPNAAVYLGLNPSDQSLREDCPLHEAHPFRTHEAALRAALELNRLGRGPLDVVKVGLA